MKKIILILLFLVISLSVVGIWVWQRNIYSKEILKLEIIGPREIEIFEEVEYTLKYKNNGNARLEDVILVFDYPDYTILEEGKSRRQEMNVDDIYPGEEKTIIFKGRIIGGEEEIKTARASMSYRAKGLKPRYESSTVLTSTIKQIPLTFNFDLPSTIEAGRELKFSLNYYSNLNYPLSNIGIKIDYPNDFEFLRSTPQSTEENEWNVPILNKGDGRRIEISGKIGGEARDQHIFVANLGVFQDNNFIKLKEISSGIEIANPLLSVFQRINGSDNYVATPGEMLHFEIFFRNVGEEPFMDLFLISRLSGELFDFESIRSDYGIYSKGDNSIVWDWRDVPRLRFIDRGEEGKVEFWVKLKESEDLSSSQGRNIVLRNRTSVGRLTEEFTTKVSSNIEVAQRGYFRDEIFGNSGPIPPRVGERTTYTIIWQAKNYYNNVKNVKVRAFLPRNVSLSGKTFPEEESSKFSYDSASREIVWDIGDMEPGKGVTSSAPNISFQISLVPEPGHKDEVISLIHSVRITGYDEWTESTIEGTSPGINTMLPDDHTVSGEDGIVQ